MSNEAEITDLLAQKPAQPKSEIVRKMLSRKTGATAEEMGVATAWQPHSVRAYLTGLRKKGMLISREERRDGTKAYHLTRATAPAGEQ